MAFSFPSIQLQRIPVQIGENEHTLTEPSGLAADQYKMSLASCTEIVDGKPKVTNLAGAISAGKKLLSDCLTDKEGKSVPVETIQSWPSRIGDELVRAVTDMLPKEGREEDLKN